MDDPLSPLCDLAINYAEQGLQIDPELGDALATLAFIHAVRYEYSEAQMAIDRLLALPGYEVVSASLPLAYVNLARMQLAWDSSSEFYRNDPLNSEAVSNMALFSFGMKRDSDMGEHYHQMLIEMTGMSIVSGFPSARLDRVDMETAVEDMRQVLPIWDISPDYANIVVPPLYDPSLRQGALVELEAMYERGDIRAPLYWHGLTRLHDTDRAVNLAFEHFDQGILNPAMFSYPSEEWREFRSHPRFIELVEYIGLASYWDEVGWPMFCELRGEQHFCGLDYKVE